MRTATLTVNHNAAGSPATYTLNCVYMPIAGLQAASSSPTNFGRTTTFTATTTAGTNVDYAWQFGDGQIGSGATVTHTYGLTGTFMVTVTASNLRGSLEATTTAQVNLSIVHANFSAAPLSGEAPLTVTFANESSGDYISAFWNFGDGQTSTQLNPIHVYAPGHYTVTVTITGFGTSDVLIRPNYLHFTRKPSRVYLPIVVNRWPPVPYNPTLAAISNADGDGGYDVSWIEQPTQLADTYTLQEATNAAFTTGLREVCTTYNQACTVGGKLAGTYFYRVRGYNSWGYGGWSNIQSVAVLAPGTPTLNAIDNADQDPQYVVAWNTTARATSYTLQQSTNAAFTGATTAYEGSSSSWPAQQSVQGTYYYRVRANGTTGQSGWSNVQSAVVNRVELIVNGGFESGPPAAPWVQSSNAGELIDRQGARTGSWGIYMGGVEYADDLIYQQVTIPANVPSPRLSYWRWILSDDSIDTAYDEMLCIIWDTSGNVLAYCGQFSNVDQSENWVYQTYDMSAFKGQAVRVGFLALNDLSDVTRFFVDDVSLTTW